MTGWYIPQRDDKNFKTFERKPTIYITGFIETEDGTDGLTEDGSSIALYQGVIGELCYKEFNADGSLKCEAPILLKVPINNSQEYIACKVIPVSQSHEERFSFGIAKKGDKEI